eukprot:Blabericola_migrator_1__3741@NODE_211_length_11365_cov_144_425828_g181_i0_p9_GENE_NODE_211_length_11365_cov_144_425828_g181_i0NODE_211_length_11365_cov_144_425828_g181_i0_p9_ORF_typecomplete_len170_score16_09STOP/PF05217_12/4_NODE_211_length_11365_cov_144_425828_g181_i0136645
MQVLSAVDITKLQTKLVRASPPTATKATTNVVELAESGDRVAGAAHVKASHCPKLHAGSLSQQHFFWQEDQPQSSKPERRQESHVVYLAQAAALPALARSATIALSQLKTARRIAANFILQPQDYTKKKYILDMTGCVVERQVYAVPAFQNARCACKGCTCGTHFLFSF